MSPRRPRPAPSSLSGAPWPRLITRQEIADLTKRPTDPHPLLNLTVPVCPDGHTLSGKAPRWTPIDQIDRDQVFTGEVGHWVGSDPAWIDLGGEG